MTEQVPQAKVVVLGEGRVGKTSITIRYVQNKFDDKQFSTMNASYLEKEIQLNKNSKLKMSIWDTAGQEQFNALASIYYKDAIGAILVYDISHLESFEKVQKWMGELKQFGGDDMVIIIVGNKCDLKNIQQVPDQLAQEYAQQNKCSLCFVSAKANIGIQDMFEKLATQIIEKMPKASEGKSKGKKLVISNSSSTQNKKKDQCC